MSLLSRRAFCLIGLGALAIPAGCLSPTLPLPPPDEPSVTAAGQGLVTLSGRVPEPNVPVLASNDDTGLFAGQNADEQGRYEFTMAAESGHRMRIWYLLGNDLSDVREFEIPRFGLEPMDEPFVSPPDATGTVTVSGVLPERLALVFVANARTDTTEDVVADDEGAFSVEIAAEAGDELELWYEFGPDPSPVIVVTVPDS